MDGRDDDVRGALATLLEPEPPMRTSVADDVRRGRALRARRQRWLAGGVAAAVVVVLGVGLGVPRLVGGTEPQPAPAATAGVSDAVQGAVDRSEKALRDLGFEPTLAAPATKVDDRIRWAFTFPSPEGYVPTRLTVVLYPDGAASPALCQPHELCGALVTKPTAGPDGPEYVQSIRDDGTYGSTLQRTYSGGGMLALTMVQAAPSAAAGEAVTDELLVVPPILTAQGLKAVADVIGDPHALVAEPSPAPTPDRTPDGVVTASDLDRLVGYWTINGTGTEDDGATLVLAAGRSGTVTLWRDCGGIGGSWIASPAGGFLAQLDWGDASCFEQSTPAGFGPTPAWLVDIEGYRPTDGGVDLLDRGGDVRARLTPGERPTPGPNRDASTLALGTVTPAMRRDYEARAVAAGVTPATSGEPVGIWVPADPANRSDKSMAVLSSDGVYVSTDGCGTSETGRWAVDRAGAALFLGSSVADLMLCMQPGAPVLTSTLVVDGTTLRALDADGDTVTTLVRQH